MDILKRFAIRFLPFRKHGVGIAVILLLSSALTVVTPFLYKEAIDTGILQGNLNVVLAMIGLIAGSFLLQEALFLLRVSLNMSIRKEIFLKLRLDLFSHLIRLPQGFYSETHRGRLLSRMTSDVDAVQNIVLDNFIGFLQNLLVGLSIAIIIWTYEWKLVAAASVCLPILLLIYKLFRGRLTALSQSYQEKYEKMLATVQEDLAMVKAIQSFSVMDDRIARTKEVMEDTEHTRRTMNMTYSKANSSTIVINLIGLFVIWGIGGYEVIEGRMSLGLLIAMSFYLTYIINLFYNAYYALIGFQVSIPAARRIFELLDEPQVIADEPGAMPIEGVIRELSFDGVGFAYPDGPTLFEQVSVRMTPGCMTAIAGKSGQGKTTLAGLLMRFYDPREGVVRVNGIDMRRFRLDSVRRKIAIVPQEDYLFSVSLRDNIVLGRSGVMDEQFEEACRLAKVDVIAAAFDNGYDTTVGENGMRLSGGQKKRVSIARALLDNPDVLIFDEATAYLDEATERELLQTIRKLADERIVVMISHDTGHVELADQVVLLRDGRVTVQEEA